MSVPVGKIKTDFLLIMIHYCQQAVNSLHEVKFETLTFILYRNVAFVMHTRILCLRITKGLKGTVSPDFVTLILFLQTIYQVLLITYRKAFQLIRKFKEFFVFVCDSPVHQEVDTTRCIHQLCVGQTWFTKEPWCKTL